MIALDSSVVIPALLTWHEVHEVARVVADGAHVPAHALLETYSVLTGAPGRLSPADAGRLIGDRFDQRRRLLPSDELVASGFERAAAVGLKGGAVYDVMIGWTALEHGATLVTLDQRAARNYELGGVPVEYLGSG